MRSKDEDKLREIVEFVERYYEDYRDSPTTEEIAKSVRMSRSNVHRYLKELDERHIIQYKGRNGIFTEKIEKMRGGNLNVALVGSIACGTPTFAEENVEEYFSLPEKLIGRGRFFLLRASGYSMVNAGIDPGDLVLIKEQSYADPGEIVVALCDDYDTTLKRYYPESKRIRLHPENDEMEDIYVKDCIIQGVAVKVLKDL